MLPNLSYNGIALHACSTKRKKKIIEKGKANEDLVKESLIYFLFVVSMLFLSHVTKAQDVLVGLTSQGGAQGGGTAFTIKSTGSGFTVNKEFVRLGMSPKGNLIFAKDGNFYGMTTDGGAYKAGTIFKMTPSGVVTILHHFDTFDGNMPEGSLTQGLDGNFYGMTPSESTNKGTIFKITSGGTFTVIKYLTTEAYRPFGNLIQAPDSSFYGLTYYGGTGNYGTVFKITPSGKLTVLHSFNGSSDGSYPNGSLVRGSDGNFYGMTTNGGSSLHYGTIFKITPTGTFTVLKSFTNTDGATPFAGLVKNSDGSFYGITARGGANGAGTIFKITSGGTFTLLRNLDYGVEGGTSRGSLVVGSDGNFYGTTTSGSNYSNGSIFKITPSGTLTVLRSLNQDKDGINTNSLIQGADGYFYGMANAGGILSQGTIFKISSGGSFSVLVSLPGTQKGGSANAGLVQAQDGFFYGMTTDGGSYNTGTIFKLCTDGSYSVLRSFQDSYSTNKFDGGNPYGNLIQGKDGNFYGLTSHGGINGYGTFFRITSSGSYTVLYSFDGNNNGGSPYGNLIQGTDGNFYGMAESGGTNWAGIIFKITTSGVITTLHSFDYNADGSAPRGSLVRGTDGNFYGLTALGGTYNLGTIFKVTPAGVFTTLHSFSFAADGAYPHGSLIQSTDGNFYGLASAGGTNSAGTIFQCTPSGTYKVLHHLYDYYDGSKPNGSLIKGSDGSLYGLNSTGGKNGGGTIFRITTAGTYTVLRHLNTATDGGTPMGNLIVQKAASLVANPQSFSIGKNTTKKVKLTGSGATPLTYTISTQPLHGKASIVKDSLTYTPATNFTGVDSIYFTDVWGCQKSAPAKIKITVTNTGLMAASLKTDGMRTSMQQEKFSVKVMPNPSSNYFTLVATSSSNDPLFLMVVDAAGQVVERKNKISVNATLQIGNNYRPGFYIAEVRQGNEKVILKLIKE